jgi:hypothetical protein
MKTKLAIAGALVALMGTIGAGSAYAAGGATAKEAEAMVKKGVA